MSDVEGKIGEIDWDEAECSGSNRQSIFLNMRKPGNYTVRVVSKPHQYFCHWVEAADGSRRKINCTHDGNCPVCVDQGKGPQSKWLLKVLYRSENGTVLRVLDAGSQILGQIRDLHKNPKFGNVSKYDIEIVRGDRNQNPLYRVLPLGTAAKGDPLTDDEKKLVKASGDSDSDSFINMKDLCKPTSREKINEVLGIKNESTDDSEDFISSDEGDEDFLDL